MHELILIDEKITEKYKIKKSLMLKINDEILNSNRFAEILTAEVWIRTEAKRTFLLILSEQKKIENQLVKKSKVLEKGNYFLQLN